MARQSSGRQGFSLRDLWVPSAIEAYKHRQVGRISSVIALLILHCRGRDFLQYGAYTNAGMSRVAYFHYLGTVGAFEDPVTIPVLLELEFASSRQRDWVLSELAQTCRHFPDLELGGLREDIERRQVTSFNNSLFPGKWGNRNRHERWSCDRI